jgi:molybdenum cofactor cytidylyltransferase
MSLASLSVLIPAAGASSRLGQPKQLLEHKGKPLIHRAVQLAQSLSPREIIVVTGAAATRVEAALKQLPVRCVHNPEWSTGMGGSIALGAGAVNPESSGLLILLCDQWRIQREDLVKLAGKWHASPEQIVCAMARGRLMPPVIFPPVFFDELRQLREDRGAHSLLKNNPDQLYSMQMDNAYSDLDTPAQLQDLEQ